MKEHELNHAARLLYGLKQHFPEAFEHSFRVGQMAVKLYPYTGFPEEIRMDIIVGAYLHDIGKKAVPKRILHKKGPLTNREWEKITRHPTWGLKYLSIYSDIIRNICHLHHRKCNGKGYPPDVDDIPDYVQFVTVLDMYDAMSQKRCYKESIRREEVLEILYKDAENKALNRHYIDILKHLWEE